MCRWQIGESRRRRGGIPDTGEDMQHDEDIILERKEEGNRLGETENRIDEVVGCNKG